MIVVRSVTKEMIKVFAHEWTMLDSEMGIEWKTRVKTLGAFVSERLVGYATLRVTGGVGYVHELMVLPDYRNKGVGKALMTEAERICMGVGCHKMTVKTSEMHKDAIRLYNAMGYTTEAKLRKDKFKLTWHLMCKELP